MNKLLSFRSALIFGGAGFVGSNWAHHLLKTSDARVHIFDNLSRKGVERNLERLRRECPAPERLKITVGDIRNRPLVERAVESATEIYHFAAQVAVTSSLSNPREDFEVNALGTLNILEAARGSRRQPFILFTSTNKVYGNLSSKPLVHAAKRYASVDGRGIAEDQPLDLYSPYGCSKGTADQYVRDYSRMFALPTVVFRMSCIAGPWQMGNEDQGWVAHFLYSALEDRPLTLFGDGRQVRDVLAVEDLIEAMERVRTKMENTAGQIYNIGGGMKNATSLLEVIDIIEQVTGKRLRLSSALARPGDQLFYVTDFHKLSSHTGWKPRLGIAEIVDRIYRWWRQEHAVPRLVAVGGSREAALDAIPESAR